MRDHIEFFRQFRRRFETTGAITPSSRFLARAITGPLRRRSGPARILEVGPGTGAVTRHIVRLLQPGDRFDLVELNEAFAARLDERFREDPLFRRAAPQSHLHICPLQDFHAEARYDFIISGLPLNNFPPDLVRAILDRYFELLSPGGVLSYFEYMYVRPMRRLIAGPAEKSRLSELDRILAAVLASHRFRRSWVFVNVPPAWVQHLRKPTDAEDSQPDA